MDAHFSGHLFDLAWDCKSGPCNLCEKDPMSLCHRGLVIQGKEQYLDPEPRRAKRNEANGNAMNQ